MLLDPINTTFLHFHLILLLMRLFICRLSYDSEYDGFIPFRSVKDLARLSLKDPVYVSVHENAKYSTPEALKQSYIICELHHKLDVLWSFVTTHKKSKVLVFLTSCKQVWSFFFFSHHLEHFLFVLFDEID